ncbi:hypothetical protein [Mitsuaria sp. 7]|uniref:hypothetical protein n=1 Tax=Mitsuaria sp. 7 TaxID=1658665 RepID=UPI0007DE1D47|nr:hypothetical protein [Mitsuaria sp. 7]ANH68638.1 hypothetical protein ABE85_15590 [Mitsuaria sp. 7]
MTASSMLRRHRQSQPQASGVTLADTLSAAEAELDRQQRAVGYAGNPLRFTPMAPAIWVAVVWAAAVGMLYAVGYLDADTDPKGTGGLAELKALIVDPHVDYAARRAALAFSGVTLAITLALSITSVVWAVSAFLKKANRFRIPALIVAVLFLALSMGLSWKVADACQPFTSELGKLLLSPKSANTASWMAGAVPYAMFFLACTVPSVLLAGATFVLQPMWLPSDRLNSTTKVRKFAEIQVKILIARVRELDQMLYIGALALVFGTLQLSAGFSIPLASMPKAAPLKAQADLCKLMSPAASAPTFFTAASAVDADARKTDARCRELPRQFAQVESADSLRELARGITLCFGLAFSALLAAVYVPALVGLRLMIEERLPCIPSKDDGETTKAIAEVDPLHRVAAVVATLSPLFAGLLANTLAIG